MIPYKLGENRKFHCNFPFTGSSLPVMKIYIISWAGEPQVIFKSFFFLFTYRITLFPSMLPYSGSHWNRPTWQTPAPSVHPHLLLELERVRIKLAVLSSSPA